MFKLSSLTSPIAKAVNARLVASALKSDNAALKRVARIFPGNIQTRSRSRAYPERGQREALRRYRRAQGGPGLVLVGERTRHPVWQPRG